MLCKGPATPGLSTFVIEAGGGAPGVLYAGLADALAAGGRRACWYDRLGYGWSDAPRGPPARDQAAAALRGALAAAGEAPPFVLVGHSAGGQLALLFAGANPGLVSGLALLDSYDSVAISLAYTGSSNVTIRLPSGRSATRPALTYMNPAVLAAADAARAVSPLGWARFITAAADPFHSYQGAANAMYGGNKAWQVRRGAWGTLRGARAAGCTSGARLRALTACSRPIHCCTPTFPRPQTLQAQWYAIKAALSGAPDASDLLSDMAPTPFWHGTGWPSLSGRPVLLLPAADTLRPGMPPGCDPGSLLASAACSAGVLASEASAAAYPSLYLAYLSTLSSNASLVVMPGGHGFPWHAARATA
jgi:pimeloyl-ACP methyl ester carboxylesterase